MEASSIAEQLYFTTIRVETVNGTGIEGVGTSFIFDYDLEGKHVLFLVTNKHVVSSVKKGFLTFLLANEGKPFLGKAYKLKIEGFEKIWHGHPKANIDVTITPFVPILQHIYRQGVNIFFRAIGSKLTLSVDFLKTIDAIEEIVFVGYPIGVWDTENFLPVVRKGITASPIIVDFQGEPKFLIDASIFPGSSGSPVFLYNPGIYAAKGGGAVVGTRLLFLGIVASVFFQEDELRIRSIPMVEVPVAVSRQMVDLGIVFKPSTIVEAIEDFLKEHGESIG